VAPPPNRPPEAPGALAAFCVFEGLPNVPLEVFPVLAAFCVFEAWPKMLPGVLDELPVFCVFAAWPKDQAVLVLPVPAAVPVLPNRPPPVLLELFAPEEPNRPPVDWPEVPEVPNKLPEGWPDVLGVKLNAMVCYVEI